MATTAATVSKLEGNLVERLQAYDEGAFLDLYDKFQQRIYRTALRILKEEEAAKDALQQTMMNIFKAVGRFRGDSQLTTWINRITLNVCFEMLRKNRKHDLRTDEDIDTYYDLEGQAAGSPFRQVVRREAGRRVHAALSRIGTRQRRVVLLHDLQGYTIREIADLLGVPEGTIKSRLFYGREELKKQLVN